MFKTRGGEWWAKAVLNNVKKNFKLLVLYGFPTTDQTGSDFNDSLLQVVFLCYYFLILAVLFFFFFVIRCSFSFL